MRLNRRTWLGVFGLVAGLGVAQTGAFAKQTDDPIEIQTFSGAFLAARVAEVDNDLKGAVAYYQRALSFNPDDHTLQQALMLALISTGSFDEALPYAEKLKSVAEVERFSRLALAVDSFRKKQYADAENWLKLAIGSDLDRLITGLMTGWAKLGAGDAAGALTHVGKLEGPEWYGLFKTYHNALIADAAGKKREADASYKSAVDNATAGGAAPDTYLRAIEAYARFLARDGKKDEALKVLATGEEFAPGRPQLEFLRADIEAGKPIAPLIGDPSQGAAEVLLDLASALNRGGGEDFVRLYLQYARALAPKSDLVLLQLGQVAEQQDNGEHAIDFYRQVPDSSPYKRLAEMQLSLNLADLERTDEAKAHLKALIEADPDDMRAYLALGGVYSIKKEYREAADLYDKAVEHLGTPEPSDWNIFYQRGIAYERLKEWGKAEPNFKQALKLMPDQPQVLNYLGYSWVDMNMNLDEALDMIRKAVELRPNDGYIVDSLGWAYYRLGRYDEAVTELERAVSLKPDDPVLNDHLGDAYWRVGRKLEATFQWSHARDMKPEPDVLAQVEKKLADGLPPVPPKAEAQAPEGARTPPADTAPPAPAPDKKSEVIDPAPQPVAAAAVTKARYVVRPGQSLWSIAADVLGDGDRYREILDLNPVLQGSPSRIFPGQELAVPGN